MNVRAHLDAEAVSFGPYQAASIPASSAELIVAFSGIGNPNTGDIPFEWVSYLTRRKPLTHAIFVRDASRSWYTTRDGRVRLANFIRRYIKAHGIQRVSAVGLSMGGAGALIMASRIGAHHVVALNPRILVGRELAPWDMRNLHLAVGVEKPIALNTIATLPPGPTYMVASTVDDLHDLAHLSYLHPGADTARRMVRPQVSLHGYRGDHNLIGAFPDRSRRGRMLDACLAHAPEHVPNILFRIDPDVCRLAREYLAGPRPADMAAQIRAYAQKHPDRVPEPFLGILHQQTIHQAAGTAPDYTSFIRETAPVLHANQTVTGPRLEDLTSSYGWAPYELAWEGAWSIGPDHFLRFRILDRKRFTRSECTLTFKACLLGPDPRQTVHVTTLDGFEHTEVVTPATHAGGVFSLTIPCESDLMEIKLHTPDHISPRRLGLNADNRELGIGLIGVALRAFRVVAKPGVSPAPCAQRAG